MPSDVSLAEVYRAIGSLTASVENLREDAKEREARAEQHRAEMRGQVAANTKKTGELEHRVDVVVEKMAKIEPLATKAQQWENRGKGALAAAGMIGGGTFGTLVYFKAQVLHFFGIGPAP